MTDFFPVGELVDRLIIARLKQEKLGVITNEGQWYEQAVKHFNLDVIETEMQKLKEAHSAIWELESSLKSGLEEQIPLEEIGKRAIKIRNLNADRIATKNAISTKLNCSVIELKQDHLSER